MRLERERDVGILLIDTERNNAVNPDSIHEANELMDEAERDPTIRALIVTSTHKSLFCPGLDLPTLMGKPRAEMAAFFEALQGLVRRKLAYPKPEVYALNGHTLAAGVLLALTGEYRVMANGFSFGLVEIDLGIAIPRSTVAMLEHVLGLRLAERMLVRGQRYTAEQALQLGLVDEVVERERLVERALEHARLLAAKPPEAYRRLRRYLRQDVADRMEALDAAHLHEFVDQWFSEETQRQLRATLERMMSGKAAARA